MKKLIIIGTILLLCPTMALAYQPIRDDSNGGNPKLAKQTYKVYIQKGAEDSSYDGEVKDAIQKWKTELAKHGIDLQVQVGAPPTTPLDLDKLNKEVVEYNKQLEDGKNPKIDDFPEMKKDQDKQSTINVYFESTEEINKRGNSKVEHGLAKPEWTFDDKGKADTIRSADVFIPTDPPGGTADIQKISIHNITLHEFGHVAGFDHYTKTQKDTGDIMEVDATLFKDRLMLSTEETTGLNTIYGTAPKIDVKEKASEKEDAVPPRGHPRQNPGWC